jgi:hypothetical protein
MARDTSCAAIPPSTSAASASLMASASTSFRTRCRVAPSATRIAISRRRSPIEYAITP